MTRHSARTSSAPAASLEHAPISRSTTKYSLTVWNRLTPTVKTSSRPYARSSSRNLALTRQWSGSAMRCSMSLSTHGNRSCTPLTRRRPTSSNIGEDLRRRNRRTRQGVVKSQNTSQTCPYWVVSVTPKPKCGTSLTLKPSIDSVMATTPRAIVSQALAEGRLTPDKVPERLDYLSTDRSFQASADLMKDIVKRTVTAAGRYIVHRVVDDPSPGDHTSPDEQDKTPIDTTGLDFAPSSRPCPAYPSFLPPRPSTSNRSVPSSSSVSISTTDPSSSSATFDSSRTDDQPRPRLARVEISIRSNDEATPPFVAAIGEGPSRREAEDQAHVRMWDDLKACEKDWSPLALEAL